MPANRRATAVVVPVQAVEPAVAAWRESYDPSARAGMPAHITLLYPFLPADAIGEEVLGELRALCAAAAIGEVVFQRAVRLGTALALYPEPAERLARLTLTIAGRWPEAPPYGGEFDDVIPHLTVAISDDAPLLDAIDSELRTRLPIRAMLDEAWLYTFRVGRWTRRAALPLGG